MKPLMVSVVLLATTHVLAGEPRIVPAPIDYRGPALHDDGPEIRDSSKRRHSPDWADEGIPSPQLDRRTSSGKFDFQFVNVAQLVSLLYGETIKTPYVISPEVLDDQRMVSMRFDARRGDLRAFLIAFLDSLGFGIERRQGVDFVFKRSSSGINAEPQSTYVYRPRYRDTAYLANLVRPAFRGQFTVNREVPAPPEGRAGGNIPDGSAAMLIDQKGDTLVFRGTQAEIVTLRDLLPQVDTPIGEVAVRATAYEVTQSTEHGSAFQLALDLLSKGLGLSIQVTGEKLSNSVRITAGDFDTVFSALSKDTRFQVINSPNLRIRSGARGKLTVGQKVPVLKSVSYPRGGGEPVQSVEYHSSGVIFELRPTVKDCVIDLHVSQQISDFVKTTTGVNKSPTLNTREVATEISSQDGDIILIGGLTTNKASDNNTGLSFLPRFLDSHADAASNTEILLVLQVERVRTSSVGSVGADAGAKDARGRTCNVRAVDARLSAARATEQRVAPQTPAETPPPALQPLTENRLSDPADKVARIEEGTTLRATAAARRVEDGGGARSAP
ncbi:type II secretory pathway protein [Pandoraea horticolens]|uniref:Type II secretory pathway protein n=1 Tax=Pandoraea horticolens TaxID=2508298 RepID=A0A5E4ZE34_9BURK|nr:type II secretory pathway protein [Pandoraea horticolens]VVE58792.1 type II secretory pathway protein [Pandoraea horticolens]